jgi:hypothetical protein
VLEQHESECVTAYCRRAFQLQEDLANANRTVADVAMVDAVLDGLERERPEWAVVVQSLQAGLKGRETATDIQPDLVVQECVRPEPRGPFAGQGTLRSASSAVLGSRWMVDSGCSDDMQAMVAHSVSMHFSTTGGSIGCWQCT